MERHWVVKNKGDTETIHELSRALNISTLLATMLTQRGVTNFRGAKDFFRPKLLQLHDPFLMKDMGKAVNRIEMAIRHREKILVYGDYDVDGTTAVALVHTFLKSIYKEVDFYIPDRYTEGYGISKAGVDYASENGITLVIALDCGIKANDNIAYAVDKKIDFIIVDHHRPGDVLPQAYAILDPKRLDCNYPYKELSGCGLGFKLIQAFSKKNGLPFKRLEKYLDLVVVSIAADIVPITGENRILAYYGLKLVNSNPRPGFTAILHYSNITKKKTDYRYLKEEFAFNRKLTISDLVFLIGPRINAAGRMESGKNSVELLISKNLDAALEKAVQINQFNTERRNLDAQITQHALEIIANDPDHPHSKATIVYHPDWHKGVLGIVASRMTEAYYRPTIVLTKSNGFITGSARSVKDFDVYNAIDQCYDLLEHFGGHKYAAGLSIRPENFEAFKKRFEEYVSNTIEDRMLIPEIEIDAKIKLSNISTKFYRILKQFAPFGPENLAPIYMTEGVVDTGYACIVGKNHLKLSVIHPDISGFPVAAIAFQQGDKLPFVQSGKPFSICYHVEENEWNGHVSLQLNIKDIKPAEEYDY
ncbi:MAG: single-stranded-DNA-specific exonuclease RecJ [Bacteroidetes bacterium 4484_276]|nr:MAG: single-stranded-DNA-specific exonuclease RecJ [Bacteroidetes bacterium 4484_276]